MPTGRKNERHYRLVVAPTRSKLTGKPVAVLGHYHPQNKQLTVDRQLLAHWLSRGAKPSLKIRSLCQIS